MSDSKPHTATKMIHVDKPVDDSLPSFKVGKNVEVVGVKDSKGVMRWRKHKKLPHTIELQSMPANGSVLVEYQLFVLVPEAAYWPLTNAGVQRKLSSARHTDTSKSNPKRKVLAKRNTSR